MIFRVQLPPKGLVGEMSSSTRETRMLPRLILWGSFNHLLSVTLVSMTIG